MDPRRSGTTSSDVVIRQAGPSDVAAVLLLCAALDTDGEARLSPDDAPEVFARLTRNPDHRIHVAVQGDRVIGTFALVFVRGLAHRARPQCIVEDVVVAADRRGQGIGRLMMQFAMRAAADADCYKLVLSSHLVREAAHRFYEGLGFRRHGYSFLIEPTSSAPVRPDRDP